MTASCKITALYKMSKASLRREALLICALFVDQLADLFYKAFPDLPLAVRGKIQRNGKAFRNQHERVAIVVINLGITHISILQLFDSESSLFIKCVAACSGLIALCGASCGAQATANNLLSTVFPPHAARRQQSAMLKKILIFFPWIIYIKHIVSFKLQLQYAYPIVLCALHPYTTPCELYFILKTAIHGILFPPPSSNSYS